MPRISLTTVLTVLVIGVAAAAAYQRFIVAPDDDQHHTLSMPNEQSYLIQSHTSPEPVTIGIPTTYRFSIVDGQGNTVKEFSTTHEKLMHLIIVRRDLTNFQHVHPEFDAATGIFELENLVITEAGPYRIFADFNPGPGSTVVYEDIVVQPAEDYQAEPIGFGRFSSTVGDIHVELAPQPSAPVAGKPTSLRFQLTRNGAPVAIEPYLGAGGHVVIIREGPLDYLHTHPIDDSSPQAGVVDFETTFPLTGTYKAFAQFQVDGQVITADFVVPVNMGGPSLDAVKPLMDEHTGH